MTEADIKIPYAIANFAELRERGYYYIDKTAYIRKLERYKAPVFLRPRRFGKSLLVSTLAHYYDRTKADRFGILHEVCGCPHFVAEGTSAESQAAFIMADTWREKALAL